MARLPGYLKAGNLLAGEVRSSSTWEEEFSARGARKRAQQHHFLRSPDSNATY